MASNQANLVVRQGNLTKFISSKAKCLSGNNYSTYICQRSPSWHNLFLKISEMKEILSYSENIIETKHIISCLWLNMHSIQVKPKCYNLNTSFTVLRCFNYHFEKQFFRILANTLPVHLISPFHLLVLPCACTMLHETRYKISRIPEQN